MTRKVFRTVSQLGFLLIATLILVLFLDSRYRVLPDSIHNHLPAHHPGFIVTDVNVVICNKLNPFASCKLNGQDWHRIDKDLYLSSGYVSKAYLHVERKREEDIFPEQMIVHNIKVSRTQPAASDDKKGEKWEARPGGIWLKRSSKYHTTDTTKVVTGVDVLFGPDAADPRSNWRLLDIPLMLDLSGNAAHPRLTMRRGPAIQVERPTPRIKPNGKFKIMQAADLHLATGLGQCRNPMPDGSHCDADIRTMEFLERMISEEKPDFVVLTGDQVNGDTAPDAQTAIFKYADVFTRHQIPYAGIFGNHDDEGNLNRAQSMAIMDGLPYSMSTAGPEDVDGVGNYVVEILGRGTTTHSALTLYMLDTHSYSPEEKKYPGYDWLKKSQVDWFRSTAQSLKRKHKEYTHIHMDLAFIHIPLPEYWNPDNAPLVGNWTEPPTAPTYNTNFKDALVDEGIVMVSCGHDHVNDYCALGNNKDGKPALWMCYGGGAGFGGYGGYYGYHRRIRFFDFDMNEGRIRTWKRLEWGDNNRIDEQIIVDSGKAILPMQS